MVSTGESCAQPAQGAIRSLVVAATRPSGVNQGLVESSECARPSAGMRFLTRYRACLRSPSLSVESSMTGGSFAIARLVIEAVEPTHLRRLWPRGTRHNLKHSHWRGVGGCYSSNRRPGARVGGSDQDWRRRTCQY